jgi:lysophospholipase L1-like esterase
MRTRLLVATSVAVASVGGVGALAARAWGVFRDVARYADYWRERAHADGDLLYIALGDSTAQAVGAARPELGYVSRLADDLATRTGRTVRVVNLSVSGARVADLLESQLPVLRTLLERTPEPALVTVSIGANDVGRIEADEFRRLVREFVDVLPPGSRVADVPAFRDRRRRSARNLAAVIRDVVGLRPDLVVVELHAVTQRLGLRDYGGDFFHPSARGYDRYYRAFRSAAP